MAVFQKVLKMNSGRSADTCPDKYFKIEKKIHLSCHVPVSLDCFRPHKISLTLLSQDSINESFSPLPEPSPYLLKTQLQKRYSKKKKKIR